MQLGDRTSGAEVGVDVRRVQRRERIGARNLHDDVQRRRHVVDDREADAVVVNPRRDLEVGVRRLEESRRVVVDEHLAPLREPRQREHAANVPPRGDTRRLDHALLIDPAHEAHLATASQPDRRTNGRGGDAR